MHPERTASQNCPSRCQCCAAVLHQFGMDPEHERSMAMFLGTWHGCNLEVANFVYKHICLLHESSEQEGCRQRGGTAANQPERLLRPTRPPLPRHYCRHYTAMHWRWQSLIPHYQMWSLRCSAPRLMLVANRKLAFASKQRPQITRHCINCLPVSLDAL